MGFVHLGIIVLPEQSLLRDALLELIKTKLVKHIVNHVLLDITVLVIRRRTLATCVQKVSILRWPLRWFLRISLFRCS